MYTELSSFLAVFPILGKFDIKQEVPDKLSSKSDESILCSNVTKCVQFRVNAFNSV